MTNVVCVWGGGVRDSLTQMRRGAVGNPCEILYKERESIAKKRTDELQVAL